MTPHYLLDSNLLVYALDTREPEKRERAKETIRRTASSGKGALPAQALAEFSNVCLRKLEPPLPPREIEREVESLSLAFPVLALTAVVVMEAMRGVREHDLAYFDAQVWAAARLGQVPVVLSEDFNTGAVLDGVRFLNPLESTFDVTKLG